MGERIKVTAKKPLSTKENSASNKQKTGFQSQNSHVDRILFLQRTIGNQAVQRLIKSGALQAKLRIGQPGDKYEQEADRVADEVMRMPEMQRQVEEEEILQTKPLVDQITPLVQRQVEEEEEEEMLQAKSTEDATSEVSNGLESQINAIKGGGWPLAESERAYFEPRFGVDFSRVRVHTNSQAAKSARVLNARAFTTGRDIVFGAGQYAPEATGGKKLLAHELTHILQQQGGLVKRYLSPGCRSFGLHRSALLSPADLSSLSPIIQRLTNPLSDMSTFQSPGASGWRGALWGCYRNNCERKHRGWDIHASEENECKAVVAGTISRHSQGSAGYGDYIVLTSTADATKKYYYAHLSNRESAGIVAEGDKVGKTGITGNASSSRPHLHFTLKEEGNKVDPDGKGFTKPTKVIEATGSTATTINFEEMDTCTPCSM